MNSVLLFMFWVLSKPRLFIDIMRTKLIVIFATAGIRIVLIPIRSYFVTGFWLRLSLVRLDLNITKEPIP
jgi:hypothetical protein